MSVLTLFTSLGHGLGLSLSRVFGGGLSLDQGWKWSRSWGQGTDRRPGLLPPVLVPLPLPLLLLILLPLGLALLSGCGFRLRGAVDIPPTLLPVFVEASGGSLVGNQLRDQFQLSAIPQAPSAREARAIVRILSESRRSRVGALDRNGKIIATEIFLDVRFDAREAGGKELVAPRTLELSRSFEDADVEVLGKQLEAEIIYADMAQDASHQILAMLRAALPRATQPAQLAKSSQSDQTTQTTQSVQPAPTTKPAQPTQPQPAQSSQPQPQPTQPKPAQPADAVGGQTARP